ncbi:MAG: PAS domain S-box protein, partial [Candidatus Sulfotelmatobacter sp.]
CFQWDPLVLWLHVISDGVIVLSYFCIPVALVYLARKRRDLPFNWIFWMFGLFIVGCGTTHLLEIWTIWHANYLLAGIVKAITAVASAATAIMLIPLIPKAIALPSGEQLHAIHYELRLQVVERERAEEKLNSTRGERERAQADLARHQCALEDLQLAQEALHQSQSQLAGIIQSAMDAIITVDESQRVVIFNAAAEKMFGRTRAEATGQSLERFIPQRFRSGHAGHVRRFAHTGVSDRAMGTLGAIWGLRANGEEFPVEASISQVESGTQKFFTVILRDITERKQAEAVREHLVALVDSSNDAIVSKDLNGTITAWNHGAEKIFGYSAAEAMGKPIRMLFPPERAHEESDILARIRRGESVEHFETVRVRKDGKKIDVSTTISPVKDGAGVIVGASNIARDITAHKRAEEALCQSDARRRFALETAKLGDWELDLTTLQAARSFLHDEIFGYHSPLPEWSFDIFLQHVHPDDREGVRQHFQSCVSQGARWEFECRIVWPSGEIRWIWACGNQYREPSGKATRMFGIIEDITEQKRVAGALAEQSEELSRQAAELTRSRQGLETQTLMLQSVLDSISEGLVAADETGKFLLWNPAATRIVGLGAANVPPEQWSNHYGVFLPDTITLFPPDQNPLVRAIRGEPSTAEMYLRNPELDTGVWIEISGNPLRDKNGVARGGVVAFRDVTQRRADEREIRKLNDELEARVIERTAALQVANHELEAFTYSVSHDLRAPLRHISGFSRILVEDFAPSLPPEAQHHLQRIAQGAARMGTLVDELLNLARVGRQSLTVQPTGLSSIVQDVLLMLEPEIAGRNVEWKIADLPVMECDPTLVRQVFQNLLHNALKYSRPRSPAVIEIGQTEKNGQPVIFVRDNGVGFSMKYADKLFGVFQRLHRAEEFEGTGVGLATVQRIVHKHGGRVWAEAEIDRGATFYFTLGSLERSESKTIAAAAASGGRK